MKVLVAVTVVCLGSVAAAGAQDGPLAIMAAPAGTTTFRAADDVARITASCGLNFAATESQGSLENLLAVNDRPLTPVAIVQGDFLEYLRTFEADDPRIAENIDKIGVVAPLFSQEVHVVAGGEIAALADLAGRKVAIGTAESGSFLTARVILDLLGVAPAQFVENAPAEALAGLQTGEIDAVFLVDGAPSALLTGAGLDPAKFRLLPMEAPVLAAAYAQATIPAGTYEIATEDTIVVTVPSVMIGFDFDPLTDSAYVKSNCTAVAGIAGVLAQRKADLLASGHPKWSEMDAGLQVPDWTRTACAEQGFSPDFVFTCSAP